MTPYSGMTLDIPYGLENASVVISAEQQYVWASSFLSATQRNAMSWNVTNAIGGFCYRSGYYGQTAVSGSFTVVNGQYNIGFKMITSGTGNRFYQWYFTYGSMGITDVLVGRHYATAGTLPLQSNYVDVYGYRDDEWVYMWNNIGDPAPGGNNTYLGYINNPTRMPLSVFYSETTPDVPEPDNATYVVRGKWKKGTTDDPGSGGGYSDQEETPSQPGSTDPPSGDSYGVGGEGEFDDTSDDIEVPSLPVVSAISTGFVNLYAPSIQNLKSFSDYMWSSIISVDTIKRAIQNPMSAIISLHLIPGAVTGPSTIVGDDEEVWFAGFSSGVRMPKFTQQYFDVNFGTINLAEYYGSALDYNPYTKINIYLPYIGDQELNTDEIMRTTIGLQYRIDILTGNCVATITSNASIMYQFNGNCASYLPISSADYSRVISGTLGAAGAVLAIGGLVSGGAGLIAGGMATQHMSGAMSQVRQGLTGMGTLRKFANAERKFSNAMGGVMSTALDYAGNLAGSGLGSGLANVMGGKMSTYHSSALNGNAGLLASGTPYLTIIRPRQSLARDYNKVAGYPTNVTYTLSELSGFVKVAGVQVTGIPGTTREIELIYRALKSGVYL